MELEWEAHNALERKEKHAEEETTQALFTLIRHLMTKREDAGGVGVGVLEPWLTPAAAADYASVSEDTLRQWISKGLLRAGRVGRVIRIRRSDIDDLLSRQTGAIPCIPTTETPNHEPTSVASKTILASLQGGRAARKA